MEDHVSSTKGRDGDIHVDKQYNGPATSSLHSFDLIESATLPSLPVTELHDFTARELLTMWLFLALRMSKYRLP
jgi:hypothetical protein